MFVCIHEVGNLDRNKKLKSKVVFNILIYLTTTANFRGTNGEQFPPFLDDRRDEPLWIFSTDLCRSMSLKYLGRI